MNFSVDFNVDITPEEIERLADAVPDDGLDDWVESMRELFKRAKEKQKPEDCEAEMPPEPVDLSAVPTCELVRELKTRKCVESHDTVDVMKEHGKALQDLLKSRWDPHCSIIVTWDFIRLVRDEIGCPLDMESD